MSNFYPAFAQCFPWKWVNGLPLIETSRGYLLVDTGSPFTILSDREVLPSIFSFLKFIKRSENDVKQLNKEDSQSILDEINKHLHPYRIDGLIGTDLLKDVDIRIDPVSELFYFSDNPAGRDIKYKGTMLDIHIKYGIPVIKFQYHGREEEAFFDTGASLSYIDKELVKNLIPERRNVQDFYPFLGEFTTELYRFNIQIAGNEITISSGILPDLLRFSLNQTGINSILGSELIKNFSIYLSIKNRFIIINKITEPLYPEGTKERWLQKFRATPTMALVDSNLEEELKDDFAGDEEVISEIEKRQSTLFYPFGKTYDYLERLLTRARGMAFRDLLEQIKEYLTDC